MSTCKALVLASLFPLTVIGKGRSPWISLQKLPSNPRTLSFRSFPFRNPSPSIASLSLPFHSFSHIAVSEEPYFQEDSSSKDTDTVEQILSNPDDISRLMKMERRSETDRWDENSAASINGNRWFPYLDMFRSRTTWLTSQEVIDALDPYILGVRKERIRRVVGNRSYSVCLVVEGLTDFGNVSAAFRSADALGFQSVHVVSCDSTKRCIEFRGTETIGMLAWVLRNGWTLNFGSLPESASKC